MPYSYEFPKADITVDCVLFGFQPEHRRLDLLMIRRGEDPFKDKLGLPGGYIEFEDGETALEAARRETREEAGVTVDFLEQLGTFDAPDRDPRGRVFSVAHYALVRSVDHTVQRGSDAKEAFWMPAHEVLTLGTESPEELAFDHELIIKTAVRRLQGKVRYEPIGFNLLPTHFTLTQLQELYEAILFQDLDKRNFRKRILAMGILKDTGEQTTPAHRPAKLYRFDKTAYDLAVKSGFNFEI